MEHDSPILLSGSSHPKLLKTLASLLVCKQGDIALGQFPDGEISVDILESVRDRHVVLLQTLAFEPSRHTDGNVDDYRCPEKSSG